MAHTLNDNALTTPDRVSELTGSDLSVSLINAASNWFCDACDRKFHREDKTEDLPGYGLDALVVERVPVVSVTSIAYNEGLLTDISDVVIADDGLSGILSRPGGFRWTAQRLPDVSFTPMPGTEEPNYQVIYRGGYVTYWQASDKNAAFPIAAVNGEDPNLPEEIELAVISVAQSFAVQLARAGYNIKSEKLMSWSAAYGDMMALPMVGDVVAKYRRCM